MTSTAWVVALIASAGCVNQAKPPTLNRDANDAERKREFDANKLEYRAGLFTAAFHRADESIGFEAVEDVANSYPASADVYHRIKTRTKVIGTVGAIGGAVIGATLGYNLGAPESRRMSRNAQIGAYSTGGGLVLTALVIALVWHNPIDELAKDYNDALGNDLKLGGTSALQAPSAAHTVAVGWQF